MTVQCRLVNSLLLNFFLGVWLARDSFGDEAQVIGDLSLQLAPWDSPQSHRGSRKYQGVSGAIG